MTFCRAGELTERVTNVTSKQLFLDIIERKRVEIRDLEYFAHVSENALKQASNAVRMVEWQREVASVLGEPSPYGSDEHFERAKAHASKLATFADTENASGQPYLFGTCTVRLCALLEALVDDLVANTLREPGRCKDQQLLGRLKGPLIEFSRATSDEQAELLMETLKQAVSANPKDGSGRFEVLLDPIGLGGSVSDDVNRAFHEMIQVRNVLMHRCAKADRRLVDGCPWLGLKRGDAVLVTGQRFHGYRLAAYWYLIELRCRVFEWYGEARPSSASDIHREVRIEVSKVLGYESPVPPD